VKAMLDSTTIPTKTCVECHIVYSATTEHFYRSKHGKYGLKSMCKACQKSKLQEWRGKNPDKMREYDRKYYAKHLDKGRAKSRLYQSTHRKDRNEYDRKRREEYPEKIREAKRKYRTKNAHKYRLWEQRRKAAKLLAETSATLLDIPAQIKRQRGKCHYCNEVFPDGKYHIDHVIPLSRGGSDLNENKVLACPQCNMGKHNKLPHEWIKGGRLL